MQISVFSEADLSKWLVLRCFIVDNQSKRENLLLVASVYVAMV